MNDGKRLRSVISMAEDMGLQYDHVEQGRKVSKVYFRRGGVTRHVVLHRSPSTPRYEIMMKKKLEDVFGG